MSTSLVSEVRIKLHIKANNSPDVKNLWMCLNYDEKPLVSHVIENVKKNFLFDKKSSNLEDTISEVKLYLDNYWLPPHENSRLIRENDCLKVEINFDENLIKPNKEIEKNHSLANTTTKLNDFTNNNLNKLKEQSYNNISESKLVNEKAQTITVPVNYEYDVYNGLYYNHYYEQNYEIDQNKHQTKQSQQNNKLNDYWTYNNEYKTNKVADEPVKEDNKSKLIKPNKSSQKELNKNATCLTVTTKQTTQTTTDKSKLNTSTSPNKPTSNTKSAKNMTNCYKKFAIGSYAHLLNDAPESCQTNEVTKNASNNKKTADVPLIDIDETDNKKQSNKSTLNKNQQSTDLEKIASNINTTGRQKWKNSTQPTKTNGPKHIIFPTSSSDSSSDSSSESSSSESEEEAKKIINKPTVNATSKKVASSEIINNKKQYYEPSKEEQLNSVSYNRSYFIKNTKDLIDFKKTFNEAKLNAPKSEEFSEKNDYSKTNQNTNLNASSMDTSSSTENFETCEKENEEVKTNKKKNFKPKSPINTSVKVDYEKLQNLVGAPRLNDKIAFQILEISSNFTPEISQYKTGMVIDFDQITNEITLALNHKYNQVLKKPTKFTVILDDMTEQAEYLEQEESYEDENLLKVDWRNLMNIKLIPSE